LLTSEKKRPVVAVSLSVLPTVNPLAVSIALHCCSEFVPLHTHLYASSIFWFALYYSLDHGY
jgi:hypothetical protein